MQCIQQNSPVRQSIFSAYVFDVYSQIDFEPNNHIEYISIWDSDCLIVFI